MKAMVLAAGKGTRLSPLTDEIPKPMVPVAGKPVMQHIFESISLGGVDEVHVNVHHLAQAIIDRYGTASSVNGMAIHVTYEDVLTGTAGAVRRLSDRFDETFVVIMGDALTDADVSDVVRFHRERGGIATLALMRVADTSQYGVVELDPQQNIRSFQEKPPPREAKSNLANTGIYVLEPEVLDYVPKDTFFDFARDVFPRLLEAGEKLVGYENGFYWSDIGTLEAYRSAQRDVLAGRVRVRIPGDRYLENLWLDRGARLHPTATLDGRVALGRNAIVERDVTLVGDVTLGQGCRIKSGATISHSILLPGSSVGPGAYLENCIVGNGYPVRAGEQISGVTMVRRKGPRPTFVRSRRRTELLEV